MKKLTLLILIPILSFGQNLYKVDKITDIDYNDNVVFPEKKDFLDIYIPNGEENYPVIVYFHGGALIAGSKEMGKDIGELDLLVQITDFLQLQNIQTF